MAWRRETAEMICTNCGAPLPTGGQHCTVCGHPYGAAASGPMTPGARPAGPGPTPPPHQPNPPGAGPYGVSAPPYPPGTPYPSYTQVPPPPAPKRSRGALVAAIAGAVVTAIALGVAAFALIKVNEPIPAGASEPLWREYFIPARVGYTCTYGDSAELGSDGSTTTVVTIRVTAVETTAEGLRVGVNFLNGPEGDTSDPDREVLPVPSQDHSYVLANDGTVHAPGISTVTGGFTVRTSDFVVYPLIADLRSGVVRDTSLTTEVELEDPAAQAELQAMLAPGESTVKMRMDIRVEPAAPTTITTPAGTYSDVVGVMVTITGIELTNLASGRAGETGGLSDALTGFQTTTWFARDVGVVQIDVGVSEFELSTYLTGCTG